MSKTNVLQTLPGAFGSRRETIDHLKMHDEAYSLYCNLAPEYQKDFLGFCTGKTSMYLCYDTFFQYIFNVYQHRHRVEGLLGALLGQEVSILEILPREGTRMVDRGYLVIMDMVVSMQDGSIVNLEIQKAGYDFPAARMDCYNADLIMRDYNRKMAEYGKTFSYGLLSPVVSIVLVERSTKPFKEFGDTYIHRGQVCWDNGIKLKNLARQVYVALDIFEEVMQNKSIDTPLEAWLTVLSTQSIDRIGELIQKYPEFADIYREIFEYRTKPEELIHMYSKALAETDRIVEQQMFQRYQNEAMAAHEEIAKAQKETAKARKENMEIKAQLDQIIAQLDQLLSQHEQDAAQHEQDAAQLEQATQTIAALQAELAKRQ